MGHVMDIGKPVNYTGGLEFSSLTYTVTKSIKDENGKWLSQEVDLLHQITGYAPKGCQTAVMGLSGAGKFTLLDGLAGRIASRSLGGKVSMGGLDMSPSLIKESSAYIKQDDTFFPMLTVYETFIFAADFRFGSLSKTKKQECVEKLIEQLGLSKLKLLSEKDAKDLLCTSAFKDSVPNVRLDLVHKVVRSCGSFPLALRVVGHSLCGQPEVIWFNRVVMQSKRQVLFPTENDMLHSLQDNIDALDEKVLYNGETTTLRDWYLDLGSFPEDQRIHPAALLDM